MINVTGRSKYPLFQERVKKQDFSKNRFPLYILLFKELDKIRVNKLLP